MYLLTCTYIQISILHNHTHQIHEEGCNEEGEEEVQVEEDEFVVKGANRQPATSEGGKDPIVENGNHRVSSHGWTPPLFWMKDTAVSGGREG